MMLGGDNLNVNILCFTKHWQLEDQMNVPNIDPFRLASNFSRIYSTSGGSCIFTRNTIQTKEVNYLSCLGSEKLFEMCGVQLSDFGTILACTYRSPDSDFYAFLRKLELLLTEVQSKGKCLILCGDLNVNFFTIQRKTEKLQNFY